MILLLVRHDPDSPHGAREQQEMLATVAAFGLPLSMVLMGRGARLLEKGRKDDGGLLAMLPAFGISEALVREDAESLLPAPDARVLPCRTVSPEELRALLRRATHAVSI